MIITCDKCSTRYNLDDSLIQNKPVVKVRCSKCNNRFEVSPQKKEADLELLPQNVMEPHFDNTISISNQKGGVAKTSTCLNLGVSFSMMDKKVLLIDFDVQANLTISLGFESNTPSFFDILHDNSDDLDGYIIKTKYDNLSLLPSNSRMALLTKHYLHKPNFEFLLRDKLQSITDSYDYIIIDTPPALGFCTLNALMTSNYVIIPTPCEYLSMHGINKIEEIIQIVQRRTGRTIDYRILITMHDARSTSSEVIYQKIKSMFKDKVLNTVIDQDQKIKESQIVQLPVIHYDKDSSSARQYVQLAHEIIDLKA